MSNVFFSEIDSYFLRKIPQSISVKNADNEIVPVPCQYHMVEGQGSPDFKDTLITFFSYDMLLDRKRLQSDLDIIVGQTQNTVSTKKVPLPYRLFYQFDIWSEWNEDIVDILPQFQRLFPPLTSIFVPDSKGVEHELFMELTFFRNADGRLWDDAQKRSQERLFRKILRYAVHTELDASQVATYQKAQEIHIPDPSTI